MTYVTAGIDAPTRATAYATMQKMSLDVRRAYRQPRVWETARSIVQAVEPRNEVAQALAIRHWVAAHTRFIKDPVDTQLLTVPVYMLDRIQQQGFCQGDCADVAELAAALCMAIGFPCWFVAVAFGSTDANYSHVFAVADAQVPGGRVAKVELDTTRPQGTRRLRPFTRYLRRQV